MKKTMLVISLVLLIVSMILVSAEYENLNRYAKFRCDIIRPATEFRAEKIFYAAGIYGRFSDGSIRCFAPTKFKPKIVAEPIRHTETVVNESLSINLTK